MTITKPAKTHSFAPTTVIKSSEVNTNFDNSFAPYDTTGYLYDGWFALAGASLEYNSADSVKTTADVNLTTDIQVGDRVTFEQSSTEKFYTVININYNSTVANRTYIQLTGDAVANSAITAGTVGFSRHIRPYKFPAVPFFGNGTSGLINGKIVPSVASNNLTVAIKTMAGTDPSVSNPVGIWIGNNLRWITSSLAVTANAGTNWFNSGSAEFATREIDYFVYAAWNVGASQIMLGFGRLPYARVYGDFVGWATPANEKYVNLVNTTSSALTDDFVNIGRFAATLSAGAGHTWSVPSFTNANLIQEPIYETRLLSYTPTLNGSGGSIGSFAASPYEGRYKIIGDVVNNLVNITCTNVGSWSGSVQVALPMGGNSGIDMPATGWVAPNAANPAVSSRAYPTLQTTNRRYIFLAAVDTGALTWGTFVANDRIRINGYYSLTSNV